MKTKYLIIFSTFIMIAITTFVIQSTAASHKSKIIYLHEQNMRSINKSALNTLIKTGNVIIVFYEDWCGPCKRMKPIFESLVEIVDDVLFIKVKRSLYRELFDKCKLTTIPAMLFFKKGKLVYIHKQSATTNEMITLITQFFHTTVPLTGIAALTCT